MYIRRVHYPLTTLGPGKRVGIYVMGCNKRCKGCMAKELQVIDERYNVNVNEIIQSIEYYYNLDNSIGVSISGGEPFLQEEIGRLIVAIKEIGISDILIYSGYKYEELRTMNNDSINLALDNISVLVDGEYIDELNDNKPLRGSSNQRIIFFDELLKEKYSSALNTKRKIEIVDNGESIDFFGIFDKGMEDKLRKSFKKNNIEFISGNE